MNDTRKEGLPLAQGGPGQQCSQHPARAAGGERSEKQRTTSTRLSGNLVKGIVALGILLPLNVIGVLAADVLQDWLLGSVQCVVPWVTEAPPTVNVICHASWAKSSALGAQQLSVEDKNSHGPWSIVKRVLYLPRDASY